VQEYKKTGLSGPGALDTQVSSPPPIMLAVEEIHAFTWFFCLGKILILCSPGKVFLGGVSVLE